MTSLNVNQKKLLKKNEGQRIIDKLKDQDLMIISRAFIFSILYDYTSPPGEVLQKLHDIFQHPTEQRRSKRTIQ